MKTKRTSLAPMAVTSLLGLVPKNETQQDITYSGTAGVLRKEVVLLEKITVVANAPSAKPQRHYPYRTLLFQIFICPFRLVHQLQKADSYFIAIFAPNTVE
jgi:hypothetical protein